MSLLLVCSSLLFFFSTLSDGQQTLSISDLPAYSSLAKCALTGLSIAVETLTNDCNFSLKPTAYASCACLKNQNSAHISQRIGTEVSFACGSTATDDISSALAVQSAYCAPVLPPSTAATTTTEPPPTLTTLPSLTQITAAATLAGCAATGLLYAISTAMTQVPPLAGPTEQASCVCLKNQNSLYLSQRIVTEVAFQCSSTATDDISSALGVFQAYCSLGAAKAAPTPFNPVFTTIQPMAALSQLTSLAPCAASAFSYAANYLTNYDCPAALQPTPFANCVCANATVSSSFSVDLVTNVEFGCSSTATADITSALAVFSSFCLLAGGARGPATAATAGYGGVTYVPISATTTFGVTGSSTPTGTGSSSSGDSGGFSQSDKIALGCGIGVGLPATIATIATLILMCRRGR